ncbi:zinc-binding dehydrogenase family superfamily [Colletotrichum sp. SAR 10_98]|nr:zinc-binding dehydrogenase family superfamily [Colletotrichum sp. SAR 10_98]
MAAKAPRLEVKETAYTNPAASEILIRNRAAAVNYVEPALQTLRPDLIPWVTYPQIFGNDIAGEGLESLQKAFEIILLYISQPPLS